MNLRTYLFACTLTFAALPLASEPDPTDPPQIEPRVRCGAPSTNGAIRVIGDPEGRWSSLRQDCMDGHIGCDGAL